MIEEEGVIFAQIFYAGKNFHYHKIRSYDKIKERTLWGI